MISGRVIRRPYAGHGLGTGGPQSALSSRPYCVLQFVVVPPESSPLSILRLCHSWICRWNRGTTTVHPSWPSSSRETLLVIVFIPFCDLTNSPTLRSRWREAVL